MGSLAKRRTALHFLRSKLNTLHTIHENVCWGLPLYRSGNCSFEHSFKYNLDVTLSMGVTLSASVMVSAGSELMLCPREASYLHLNPRVVASKLVSQVASPEFEVERKVSLSSYTRGCGGFEASLSFLLVHRRAGSS